MLERAVCKFQLLRVLEANLYETNVTKAIRYILQQEILFLSRKIITVLCDSPDLSEVRSDYVNHRFQKVGVEKRDLRIVSQSRTKSGPYEYSRSHVDVIEIANVAS